MRLPSCHLLIVKKNFRFKPAVVKDCIREIVRERLSGTRYDPEQVPELSRSLADCIKDKVKSECRLLLSEW